MVFSLAAFGLLVAFNNVTDYRSNHQFVRHVLSMDDTFRGNALMWRAVRAPWLWDAAYWVIIATEFLTGALFAAAGVALARNLRAPGDGFARAKHLVHAGVLCGFLLWFAGFTVVGGEWFLMWQSAHWNGQAPAFRFFITMLAVGIYVQMPD